MLAFVPIRRLKVTVTPNCTDETRSGPDLEFSADRSNPLKPSFTRFVTALMEVERWEQDMVHLAMGHLLGRSYVDAVSDLTDRLARVTGTSLGSASAKSLQSFSSEAVEEFEMPTWIAEPEHDGIRQLLLSELTFSRFPMTFGPDPEFAVRPWLPEALKGILALTGPVNPCLNQAVYFYPDRLNHTVSLSHVVGALAPSATSTGHHQGRSTQ